MREWLVYRTGALKWKNVCVSRMVPVLEFCDSDNYLFVSHTARDVFLH